MRSCCKRADSAAKLRFRGMSDRTIAWIFVAPTIFLLLAINIFPLIWTIRLSFTNFRVNRPNEPLQWVGLRNYQRILGDADIWATMQNTAQFLFWTLFFQILIGFALASLINRKFRGNDLWTTIIVLPMMLSPAVVGNFWTFLYQPQIGLFNYAVAFVTGGGPGDTTLLTSINLKREAFEKWRTGYASAYAVILFVTINGLASIYVKALNRVKQR